MALAICGQHLRCYWQHRASDANICTDRYTDRYAHSDANRRTHKFAHSDANCRSHEHTHSGAHDISHRVTHCCAGHLVTNRNRKPLRSLLIAVLLPFVFAFAPPRLLCACVCAVRALQRGLCSDQRRAVR